MNEAPPVTRTFFRFQSISTSPVLAGGSVYLIASRLARPAQQADAVARRPRLVHQLLAVEPRGQLRPDAMHLARPAAGVSADVVERDQAPRPDERRVVV